MAYQVPRLLSDGRKTRRSETQCWRKSLRFILNSALLVVEWMECGWRGKEAKKIYHWPTIFSTVDGEIEKAVAGRFHGLDISSSSCSAWEFPFKQLCWLPSWLMSLIRSNSKNSSNWWFQLSNFHVSRAISIIRRGLCCGVWSRRGVWLVRFVAHASR